MLLRLSRTKNLRFLNYKEEIQGGIADWDEGATVAQSKDDGRYETMKPVQSPSNHWEDSHGTIEKEKNQIKRVASMNMKDDTTSTTGLVTVMHERINDHDRGEIETTNVNGTKIATVFDSCSPVTTVRHYAIAETKIIKIKHRNTEDQG